MSAFFKVIYFCLAINTIRAIDYAKEKIKVTPEMIYALHPRLKDAKILKEENMNELIKQLQRKVDLLQEFEEEIKQTSPGFTQKKLNDFLESKMKQECDSRETEEKKQACYLFNSMALKIYDTYKK